MERSYTESRKCTRDFNKIERKTNPFIAVFQLQPEPNETPFSTLSGRWITLPSIDHFFIPPTPPLPPSFIPQLKCLQCLQRFPSTSELAAHISTHREEIAMAMHRMGAARAGRGGAGANGVAGEEIVKAAALLEQQEKTLQNGLSNGR